MAIHKSGMQIPSMCLSCHRRFPYGSADPAIRKKAHEMTEQAIKFCRDLGIRVIQLAGYDVYYEESTADTRRFFEENLRESVLFAAEYGVVLAFETMETPPEAAERVALVICKNLLMDGPLHGED